MIKISKLSLILPILLYSNISYSENYMDITKTNILYLYESHTTDNAAISTLLTLEAGVTADEFSRNEQIPKVKEYLSKYKSVSNIKYSNQMELGEFNFKENNFDFPIENNSLFSLRFITDPNLKLDPTYMGTNYCLAFEIEHIKIPVKKSTAKTIVKNDSRIVKLELFGTIKETYKRSRTKVLPSMFGIESSTVYDIYKCLTMKVKKVKVRDLKGVTLFEKNMK